MVNATILGHTLAKYIVIKHTENTFLQPFCIFLNEKHSRKCRSCVRFVVDGARIYGRQYGCILY